MKKIIILVLAIAVVGAVVWKVNSRNPSGQNNNQNEEETKVPTSQTVKVSDKLSEYKNDELGFAVKYPTAWERGESPTGINFSILSETDKEKNTIGNLQAKVDVISGKCAFPPVTTIKERDTLKVGDLTFNMISIANTVQNRSYFNRMYTIQKDSICYFLTFSAITLSPSSKGFTGADIQTVGARNKVLVDTADTQFKDMVKTFVYVVGPAGKDEATVSPKK